ncbi:hypothetical protein SBOR_7172 [Sclerotinia borealis F-4128]|uniref:ABM domain-containing protein n=1 Tax=Sclerotinia borealis (strain F-4128) TaxID=1432307 RepID=W9CD36_SCLBF|nr:hypothetical protein SBOR_7172 [Sclerotinia borealis F-4128]
MAPIHCVAIITPAPGKEARVCDINFPFTLPLLPQANTPIHLQLRELLTGLGNNVEKHEKGVSKYQIFEQYSGEKGNVFVVQEIYEDEAAHEAHFKTSYFTALGKILPEEGVLGAPLDIKTIKPIAGFESR